MLLHQTPRPATRPAAFEANLAALGCQSIASTPYHPQTCGKIERFWQTLKKWLRAREAIHGLYRTLAALNRDLAVFAEHYNTRRPHRALNGRTPATVFAATVKARPAERPLPATTQIYRTHASTGGTVIVSRPDATSTLSPRRRPLQTTARHRDPRRQLHRDLHRQHPAASPPRRPHPALPTPRRPTHQH